MTLTNMKNTSGIIVLLFCFLVSSAQESRSKMSFNDNWKFRLDNNLDFAAMDWDDSEWRSLNLPHDWSIEGDFDENLTGRNAWLPAGIAWYRKTFDIPEELKGKHIEIQFDGIYKNATIWLNQNPVGIQHDGYTSFYFDITELLIYGEENVLAIRVDNSIQPNCRWYSGSGIYRNVWLTIASPTHVKNWGTYITTPTITEESAVVKVVTTIENFSESKSLTLETRLIDRDNNEVAKTSSEITVGRYCEKNITQTLTVNSPLLWSVDKPNMYSAVSTIKSDSKVIDEYRSPFGIRTIGFDADKGFFLNGKNMKMKGVCLHHDGGPVGAAVTDEVWERRLKNLKAIGCNAIRVAHNPASPEFMNMCDQMGFLVMNEFVDKWDKRYRKSTDPKNPYYDVPFNDPNFAIEWQKNYRETIRRDRNHPSVILWSVGNENHPPGTEGQNNGLRTYASYVRSMDPTRPVISGMERGLDKPVAEKVADIIETCTYMDLIALNYGEQWCKLIGEQNPGKPYVSTESYTYFNSSLENRWALVERSPWLDVIDNDHNMGLFLWVGIAYLGESRNYPRIGSTSGLYDFAGFRTNRSYLWEAFWSEKPVVHLEIYKTKASDKKGLRAWSWPFTTTNWNREKGDTVDLVSYTNCESVDLYLNNKKIGNKKLKDFSNWIMNWENILYEPGTLKAVGIINGKAVCESSIRTTGTPSRIELKSDLDELSPEKVFHIELQLTDKKGNPVVHTEKDLTFNIEGDAEIIGIHNGSGNSVVSNRNVSNRNTYRGRCLCIIRVKKAAKSLKLTVSGDGLKNQVLEL